MSLGLHCPKCSGELSVTDSRPMTAGIRRRRLCGTCGHRLTTHELLPLYVPDGKDSHRYGRANEVRELMVAMDTADAAVILALAERLAAKPVAANEDLAA